MRAPSPRRIAVGLLPILLLLAVVAPAVSVAPSAGTGRAASLGADPSTAGLVDGALHARGPAVGERPGPAVLPSACTTLRDRFGGLYDGPALPPSVRVSAQSTCPIGYDEAGIGLVSNASTGGSRSELTIALPPANGGATRAIAAYEIGLWVAGVPCSAGGASMVAVDLVPPFGGSNVTDRPNWTVWAPAFDLVPAGGCDPTCENETALFSLTGSARSFCEDDAIVRGPLQGTAPIATVRAGDTVTLAFVGSAGSSAPLAVFLNDTTLPSARWSWNYSGNDTISGLPLTPLANLSSDGSGAFWGYGPALSVRALLCPSAPPAVAPNGSACNSYDGPTVNDTGLPVLLGAAAWNASSATYSLGYGGVTTFSSSGGCSGLPGTAPCVDFGTGGGTANYPFFGLGATGGTAQWRFGGANGAVLAESGGSAQFDPAAAEGSPRADTSVSAPDAVVVGTTADLTARVTGFGGIGNVGVTGYFCFSGGTATVVHGTATESLLGGNGPGDGNFSAHLTVAGGYRGSFYALWNATPSGGGPSGSVRGATSVVGGATACSYPAPAPPYLAAANVTAIGGGYRLQFAENDSAVTNYTLTLAPVGGGQPITENLTGDAAQDVFVGVGGVAYNLSVTAYDLAGKSSTSSAAVAAAPTLEPLAPQIVTGANGDLWIGADSPWVNVSVNGGIGPYRFTVALGDGSTVQTATAAPYWNLSDALGDLDGVAWIEATVVDAADASATTAPVGVSVLAGPLAVNQSISAGALDARLSWSAPLSPDGAVTVYTVFYTNRSSEEGTLASLWSTNRSADGAFLWNTTGTSFDVANVPPDSTYYFLVVAWDALGIGLLPSGWLQTPSGTLANLSAAPLLLGPVGGPAPLTVSVSDEVQLGTNGTLTEGLYSFGASGSVAANLTSNLSGRLAYWWLNASWTFDQSGLEVVLLHVTDAYSDTQIPVGYVYVGPAAPPSALARVTSGTAVVGEPVSFEGIAGGGTGSYAYNWSFGDGGVSTEASPAHTYVAPGNYSATLEVTDTGDGENAFAEANVTVFAPPAVAISVSAADATGADYVFTALVDGGVGGLRYAWTFGDGVVGNGPTARHSYAGAGLYQVNLTVTDGLGETASASVNVSVPAIALSTGTTSPGITGPELAAYALLAALAVVLFIGLVYFWSKSRGGPDTVELPPVRRPPPEPPADVYDDLRRVGPPT